jgi:hypothetical protein
MVCGKSSKNGCMMNIFWHEAVNLLGGLCLCVQGDIFPACTFLLVVFLCSYCRLLLSLLFQRVIENTIFTLLSKWLTWEQM